MESPNSMVSTLYIFTPFDDVMGWVLLFSPLFSHGGQVQFLLSREPFCLITAARRVSSLPPIPSVCPSPKLHWLSTFSHSTQGHYTTCPSQFDCKSFNTVCVGWVAWQARGQTASSSSLLNYSSLPTQATLQAQKCSIIITLQRERFSFIVLQISHVVMVHKPGQM